ncbi:MAG: hypothetical protein LQ337_000161 [Flavoplaca oasis]|nr:MAG: hypothetical protein LQ337_000161 [Flavoplaca oasis]
MASTVVVIDASARRATIRTTPGMILSDVLQEACGKLGADANGYGLKHKNKKLDLSNPIRLSGLSAGAKLELVQLSRSPSVVSVALQLPEIEAHSPAGGRLIEKYPSSTTLWLILRNFESMAPHRNYTARAKTRTETGGTGSGRLYHEAPVLSIMGRELTSFTDLQKTLAQLGYNAGSVLLRLTFRLSDTPIEEAMEQIERYFKSVSGDEKAGSHATSMTMPESVPDTAAPVPAEEDAETKTPPEPDTPSDEEDRFTVDLATQEDIKNSAEEEPDPSAVTGPGQRPISIFKPPESSTPQAARQAFNERDYEPTVAHAKLHQARLQGSGRNKTLPSDKELADREIAKAQRVADIKDIAIKIRFPDQSAVNATFTNLDTARSLYDFARGMMAAQGEPFLLNFRSARGPRIIPLDGTEKLILDLGMSGSTLVNFFWGEGASLEARAKPVMKENMLAQAKEIEVPKILESDAPEPVPKDTTTEKPKASGKGDGKGKMPKWFKGLGKK